jgi:ATP-dependent protease ClpP protease subunit
MDSYESEGIEIDKGTDNDKDKIIIKNAITKNEYIVNVDTDILDPDEYREVFEILRTAKKEDKITLKINSMGGYIHTMVQWVNALLYTKAKTISEVYTAYSAASVIALCCDEIKFQHFCSMMIHNMSLGIEGKISDVEGYAKFAISQDKEISNLIYNGFLTKDELKKVNSGSEIWLDRNQCLERIKNFKPIKQRLLK